MTLACVSFVRAQVQEKVIIDVAVTTDKGALVAGLKPENFSVTVGKIPQGIVGFENGSSPVNIGILLDNSGSLKQSFSNVREAMGSGFTRFTGNNNNANKYFVAAFNTQAPILQDWSSDPTKAVDQFYGFRFQGATLLFDSIFKGTQKVLTGPNPRNVLIIMSDGQDSYSEISFNKLRDFLKKTDVTVYCIGLLSRSDWGSSLGMEGQGVLDELASVTGGRALFLPPGAKGRDLENIFEILSTELRSQYRIAIRRAGKGEWLKIKVRASHKDNGGKEQKLMTRHRELFFY